MPFIERSSRESAISGLAVVTPKQITDERGTVREFFRLSNAVGNPSRVAQVNVTNSGHGAIRGLHGEAMNKLVGVVAGEGFGAYVDARPGSSTFGIVETVRLVPGVQVLVPSGVLNGFQCTSDAGCEYVYVFDAEWSPDMPGTACHALDPELHIPWPVEIDPGDRSLLSARDAALPSFKEIAG